MPRPNIDLSDAAEKIYNYSQRGCNLKEISRLLGCSEDTLSRRMKTDTNLRHSYEQGRETANLLVKETAFQLATSGKCPAMTMFWLKTQCRWSETSKMCEEENLESENTYLVPAMTRENARKLIDDLRQNQA